MASVTINGLLQLSGDVVLVDVTVDGAHNHVHFLRSDLERLGTVAQRQRYIALQCKSAAAQTITTNANPNLAVSGATTVGGTSVTVNGYQINGEQVLMDVTVGSAHHRVQFDRKQLEALPSDAARREFVARQAKSVDGLTISGSPSASLAVTGTLTV